VFLFKPLSDFNVNAETTTPCPLLIKEGSYMFVSGLLKVARDFASEIEPYTLFSGDLKYLFGSGILF
jgi:hypothetical protein